MVRQVRSGNGWRLGWNPEASEFCGLVGSEDWAIELTASELNDFCRLANQLAETIHQLSDELMEEERFSCEVESDLLWLEAEGYPKAYCLRFILLTGRRGEGAWAVEAVPGLLQAIQVLHVF